MKRYVLSMILSILMLSMSAAMASNAPTSQFGYSGWPYLQQGQCLIGCSQCGGADSCLQCSFCQAVTATARPNAQPAPTPVPRPTPKPTLKPTAKPTSTPAIRPTAKPLATPSTSTGDYTTISVTAQEQKALNLLNADRAAQGLPPLTLDSELSRIARIKSQDMKDNRYFAHTSPTYGNAASMLKTFGYSFNGVGENIAHHATVEKSQAAFMSSDGHRRNILGSQWQKVGIGVCYDNQGFVYVTQLFVR